MAEEIIIRKASESDIAWIQSELKKFSAFYGSKLPLYPSEEYSDKAIRLFINDHYFSVAERAGKLMGFISGFVSNHIYNPSIKVLTESFWWVAEEFRGTRAGLMLINEFVAYGKEVCDWIIFTLEHHSPVSDRTLLKRGFKEYERSFILEVR